MNTNHPKWIKKYVHKSKINAVHIVDWEDHHHIATIPHVYTHNGEKSEGAQAADLIVAAHDLLEVAKVALSNCSIDNHAASDDYDCSFCNKARAAIAKATGE